MRTKQELLTAGALSEDRNEDAVGAGADYLFVIDGASGLTGDNRMGQASDARWFAQEMAAALARDLPVQSLSTESILTRAVNALAAQWPGALEDGPSAGIALWRRQGDSLEYFGLGDCDASAQKTDGSIALWQERRLTALDAGVLAEMTALCRRTGCTMAQAREACAPQLIRNRNLRNTPEGYWCLDLTGAGIPHARRASLPASEVRSLFVCSDGFSQLIGFGVAEDLPSLHRLALARGLSPLKDLLYQLQERDRDWTALPRFKFRDDTSAGLLEWEEHHA